MGNLTYHKPVLADEAVALLCGQDRTVFVDGTLGGGGHFDALGEKLGHDAILIGIDRDPDAVNFNISRQHPTSARIIIEQCCFSELDKVVQKHGILQVHGILLDLGVSSFQIDNSHRGFSFMQDCTLDMRMNPVKGIPAHELIKVSSVSELGGILKNYGEVRNALRMAECIKAFGRKIHTSGDLKECLAGEYGGDLKYKILAKVFMALRIAVNDELGELERTLETGISVLAPGGRMAVITYHSLEDRIVKEFFRGHEPHCTCPKAALMCTCGRPGDLTRITRKPVTAGAEEVELNPRSRSALLRVVEKKVEVFR